MKIYTSYFANAKALKAAGVTIIGIALYPPRWYKGASIKYVAPTYSILKHTKTDEEYTERYKKEILGSLNDEQFLSDIKAIAGSNDVALCCYEKPTDFCHRQLLADYLNERGWEIEEFVKKEKPEPQQLTLF